MLRQIAPVVLFFAPVVAAQESSAILSNPFNTPADRIEGARLFRSQCANCHAEDGRGTSAGPDLSSGAFKRASSDEGLFQVVAKGVPGTVMPGFSLSGREIWQVLAFIRSLSISRARETVTGDASRGAALFRTHGCGGCHDGLLGPALGESVRRKPLFELRRSITDPQVEVESRWWRLRAATHDGAALSGRRLNEDTHSVQYADPSGRLRTVSKADLTQYEIVRKSPMPPFDLTDGELDDLLAYLVSGAP